MEVHTAPAVAKRMWSYLRAAFFMMRKGVLSNKRKLLVSMHLLMKRRNKAVARTITSLLSHHGHHHGAHGNALRRRDYEFSCSNSPGPAGSFSASRHRLAYFPCLGAVSEEELRADVASPAPLARIEYYAAAASPSPSSPGLLLRELAPGEEYCTSPAPGAGAGFSVRVSNYSSEEEGGGSEAVDDEAEEFIRRFYEQLRRQNTIALLPYLQESAA
ncbi:uncharacterized protein LOC133928131 [Phragmites australis]|uniref:uncharacterized protein LOC133928131 n=1 Tax=Phragmites australis TaxID=29695 RepID=UPI002D7A30D5|nr:uncharacterized protein LOC133928131 [Phragmites australis]